MEKMFRRGLFSGAAALAAYSALPKGAQAAATLPPVDPANYPLRIRRQARVSLSLTSSGIVISTQAAVSTRGSCFPVPDDAYAVRFAFGNPTTTPYTINGVCFVGASTFGDYVNPTGGGTWAYATVGNAGADIDLPAPAGSSAASFSVPGNATDPISGATNVPALFLTDWNLLAPVAPASGTMRVLNARVLYPIGSSYLGAFTSPSGWTGVPAANQGWDFATFFTGGDAVTTPATHLSVTANSSASPILFVQFLLRTPAVSVLFCGDSQFAGDTTAGYINNFVTHSCLALSSILPFPIVPCSAAWGGQPEDTFWPIGNRYLPIVQPSVFVMEGWSGNDTPANADATWRKQLARLLMTHQRCDAAGIPFIVTTPMPRNAAFMAASGQVSVWQNARNAIQGMAASGAAVIDASSILGTVSTGRYLAGMSTDDTHPNDTGVLALSGAMVPLMQRMIGATPKLSYP